MDLFGDEFFLPGWVLYTVLIISTIYIYLTWNFGYLEKQGVKCPRPYPFVGTLYNAFLKPMHEYEAEIYGKFGRTFGLYEGGKPVLYVADPEMLKLVLIKDFNKFSIRREMNIMKIHDIFDRFLMNLSGEEWKSIRKIIAPSFTQGKMKLMMPLVDKCAKDLTDNIHQLLKSGMKSVPMKKNFESFSMDLIGSCAFATVLNSQKNPDHPFVAHARRIFKRSPILALALILPVKVLKVFKTWILPCDSLDYFERAVLSVIEARRLKPQARTDFLKLLMAAGANSAEEQNGEINGDSSKAVLSEEMIVSQAVMFFLAGFDTTSLALVFVAYFMATYPECQDKLYQEIREVLESTKGENPSLDELFGMKYLDMVVNETLRFFPPIPRTFRTAVEDVDLGVARLKKGNLLAVPIYAIHHDEQFYPEPEVFNPERFLDKSLINSVVYLPFGGGPRNCIGTRFALIEVKAAIFQLVHEFHLSPLIDTPVPLKFDVGIGFLRLKELSLCLQPRSS